MPAGFYNENAARDYPFVQRVEPISQYTEGSGGTVSHLPHSAIVDFGAILELDVEYDEGQGHYVYLHAVERVGSNDFLYEFRINAPGGENYDVSFSRNVNDGENAIEWADASTISPEIPDPYSCEQNPRWRAFLVTGRFDDLSTFLTPGQRIVFREGLWRIEPSRVQSLAGTYLRSCTLANTPRTKATFSQTCEELTGSSIAVDDDIVVRDLCIAGDVQWKEGYNCSIRQEPFDNAIVITAAVGAGAGQPCDEVPIIGGEEPPPQSPHLSGGPACNGVVRSINGIGGPRVTIVPGTGFQIYPDPDDVNGLVIDRSLDDFVTCLDQSSEGSD